MRYRGDREHRESPRIRDNYSRRNSPGAHIAARRYRNIAPRCVAVVLEFLPECVSLRFPTRSRIVESHVYWLEIANANILDGTRTTYTDPDI